MPTQGIVQYDTKLGTDPQFSQAIWGDCPLLDDVCRPGIMCLVQDDFANFPTILPAAAAAESYTQGPYTLFIGTDTVPGGITTLTPGGGIALVPSVSPFQDNQVTAMGIDGGNFQFSVTNARKLWFEARIKVNSIADTIAQAFVGLGTVGTLASEELILTDAGGMGAAGGFIGFRRLETDGDMLDVIYQAAGQVLQTKIADAFTLVADTEVKCGFVYDPAFPADKRIKFFFNGVEQSTYITATNIAAATFPEDEPMNVRAAIKGAAAAAASLTIRGWRLAQLNER